MVVPVDTAGLLAMTQHARHVSCACCDSYCVCIVCVYINIIIKVTDSSSCLAKQRLTDHKKLSIRTM